jgi:PAS domain S-box-containing protein
MRLPSRTMFLSLYHDITVRKRTEQALQESQGRFRVMFESNPLPSWVFEYDTLRFLEVNEAMVRHYGFTREELLQMEISEIRPPEELPRLTNVLREIRLRPAYHTQMRHRAKDGRMFDVHISWNTFWYEQRRAVLVVAEDVSELNRRSEDLEKAIEAAEQANRAKTEFLATMSHELRTPLNGVIGTTSLLMETPLSSEQREYVDTIRTSGVALLSVINDILTLSRLESGPGEPEISSVEPEETIETVLEMFSAEADSKNLDLLRWVDQKVPQLIRTDGTRLRQVLVNLVSNGIKFTERGHVAVAVSLKRRTADAAELEFTVSDTGAGIPADRLDRLFKPFSQADMSSTRKFGGTGLGLAIASRLVELMKGQIRVETTENRGSTFFFTIPVEPVHTEAARAVPALPGKDVWVLEPDVFGRTILHKLFAGQGALVHAVTSREELLELATPASGFDLLVCTESVFLSREKNVLAELRARFSREVPAIVLTLPSRREALSRAIPPGVRIMAKPVRHTSLVRAASELVAGIIHPQTPAPAVVAAPLRILVAEDNAVNQKLMLRMLKNIGYDADMAANGIEVLDAIRRIRYDIVFMDIHMPEMDGIEASRQIREILPEQERPYVIAMTAYVDDQSRHRCAEAGMRDYLAKPVLVDDVRDAIARASGVVTPLRSAPSGRSVESIEDSDLRARLEELGADGESAFMRELVQAFLNEVPAKLDGIANALRMKNSKELEEEAHALKGSSMNMGASRLASLARALEDLGRQRKPIADDLSTAPLRKEFGHVREQLLLFVSTLK